MSLTFTQVLGIVLWNFITMVHYMAPQFTYPIFPKDFDIYPPDIIHVISVPRPSPFFAALPFSCIICKLNNKTGRPGNKANSKPLWINVKIFWEKFG